MSIQRSCYIAALALVMFTAFGSADAVASMTWTARMFEPTQIDGFRKNPHSLEEALMGAPSPLFDAAMKKTGRVNLDDKAIQEEVEAWSKQRAAEVGDTTVDLDKAWHGLHFLLSGDVGPTSAISSHAILGGKAIGEDMGYGPANVLMPDEVKAISQALEATAADSLSKRFDPRAMDRMGVYPSIWLRDGQEALKWLLETYPTLVAFYRKAAERGDAVIWVIN